ncbi:MAG: restriction endonuclease [Zoogloea sp.]|nr:restriction endonuclease [Zoogloea sp.]
MSSPWQISVALAALTYVGLKWVLPGLVIGNPILKALAGALAPQAGLFAGVFLFIAVLAFVKTKAGQVRRGDSAATPGSGIDHRLSAINYRRELQGFAGLPVPENAVSSPGAGKPAVWTIELIRDIEWKRFEDVCQQYYESKGIRSETTALGPDGGIDIRLFPGRFRKGHLHRPVQGLGRALCRCEARARTAGCDDPREDRQAFFATSGKYSDEARILPRPIASP